MPKPKYDAFISHSISDYQFVEKLEKVLEGKGRTIWIDRTEVQPSEKWIRAIQSGIEASDNFLFVVSPDALASANCRYELEHAVKHSKRIIPVLARNVDKGTMPDELAERKWVDFRDSISFKKATKTLLSAFDVDLNHVREHTRILTKAIDWEARHKNRSLLLRGKDLTDSESWLSNSDSSRQPKPTQLQTQFVLASRRYQIKRQRLMLLISLLGLIVATLLAVLFFYQRNLAVEQEHIAKARRLLAQAEVLANEGKGTLALSLTIESMRRLPSLEADQSLRKQLRNLAEPVAQLNFDAPAESIICSSSGNYCAVSRGKRWQNTRGGNTVWILEASTGKKITELKHDDNVNVTAFSRSEKQLATASDDGTVRIWDRLSGSEIKRFNQDGGIRRLAFSPDEKYLAAVGRRFSSANIARNGKSHKIREPEVFLWEIQNGRLISSPAACETAGDIRWDKVELICSDDSNGRVVRWNIETGDTLIKSEWRRAESSMSSDGRYIAKDISVNLADEFVDDEDYSFEISDFFNDHAIGHISHKGFRPEITLSPNGKYLAIGDLSSTSVWEVTKPREVLRLTGQQTGTPTAFTGDSKLIAILTSDGARVWDLEDEQEVARIPSDTYLSTAVFNGDGSRLITGNNKGLIQLWKMPSGREFFEVQTSDRADTVWFDPGGKTIRALSFDGTLVAWNLETREQISSSRPYINAIDTAFNLDRTYVAVNENNERIHILDWSARAINPIALNNASAETYVSVKALSPTAKYVVIDRTPRTSKQIISHLDILETSTGKQIARVVHEALVWAVTFTEDEKHLVTGGRDGTVRVWLVSNGLPIKRIEAGAPVDFLRFTMDDKFLVTGGEALNPRAWETLTWEARDWLRGDGPVSAMASSSDGKYLAIAGQDGIATIWDVLRQEEILRLKHEGTISFVVFSKDSQYVLTTQGYKTVRVWELKSGREIARFGRERIDDVDISSDGRYLFTSCCNRIQIETLWPGDLMNVGCAHLARNLTVAEWQEYIGSESYRKTCPGLP